MAKRFSMRTKREYVDPRGDAQTRWITIGSATQLDDGGLVGTLDSVPLASQDWDGTFWLYPIEKKKNGDEPPY